MPGARQPSRARRRRLLAATLVAALIPATAQAGIVTEPKLSRVTVDNTGGAPVTVELVRNGIVIGHAAGLGDISVNRAGGECWAGFTPEVKPGDVVRAGAQSMTVQGPLIIAAPGAPDLTGSLDVTGDATGAGPFSVSLPGVVAPGVAVATGAFVANFTGLTATPAAAQIDAGPAGGITRVRSDDPGTASPASGCPPYNPDAATAVDAGHLVGGAPVINAANAGQPLTVSGPAGADGPVTATLSGANTPTTATAGTWSALFSPAQLASLPEGPLVAGVGGTGATLAVLKDTLAPPQPASSPPPGRYLNAPTVSLSAEPGSRIHFTVDGSTPTAASPVYTAPVRVGSSSTLRAFAIDAVGNAGQVAALAYQLGAGAGAPGGGQGGANNQGPTKPSGTAKPGAARISLLKISKRQSLKRLRQQGLGVGVQLSSGTSAVRFMMYRRTTRKHKTTYRLVASVVRSTSTPRYRARLNARALGLVRTGVYRLKVVPGLTRTTLDGDAARTIFLRVVR